MSCALGCSRARRCEQAFAGTIGQVRFRSGTAGRRGYSSPRDMCPARRPRSDCCRTGDQVSHSRSGTRTMIRRARRSRCRTPVHSGTVGNRSHRYRGSRLDRMCHCRTGYSRCSRSPAAWLRRAAASPGGADMVDRPPRPARLARSVGSRCSPTRIACGPRPARPRCRSSRHIGSRATQGPPDARIAGSMLLTWNTAPFAAGWSDALQWPAMRAVRRLGVIQSRLRSAAARRARRGRKYRVRGTSSVSARSGIATSRAA